MSETSQVLKLSPLSQAVAVEGHRFEISIISPEKKSEWTLEVLDDQGISHTWNDPFATDKEALQAALDAFAEEGAAGFLDAKPMCFVSHRLNTATKS
jgi:hypothetical protein